MLIGVFFFLLKRDYHDVTRIYFANSGGKDGLKLLPPHLISACMDTVNKRLSISIEVEIYVFYIGNVSIFNQMFPVKLPFYKF